MSVQAVLRILNGPHKSERLVFEEPREYVVGRKRDCDLPVTDGYMSRMHFKIAADGEGFVVEDLGSSHGTLLNGRKLAGKTVLQDGDLIRAGQTDFVFQSGTEVRALGTSSKTVMGSPKTMFDPVSKLPGDSSLGQPSAPVYSEPATVAAHLSPEQLAAIGGGTELSDDFSDDSVSPGTVNDPDLPATSAIPLKSSPQAVAPLPNPAVVPPVAAADGQEEEDVDEWESVWESAPGPSSLGRGESAAAPIAPVEPVASDPDTQPAGQKSRTAPIEDESAGAEPSSPAEEDLDWWTA